MSNSVNKKFAATVGTFDGVHRGHLKVLETLRQVAAAEGLTPLAITFESHPLRVIAPERTPHAIMSTAKKIELLRKEGVATHIIDFSPSTACLSAAEWMRRLHDLHGVECIVIGYDNTFGHDGRFLTSEDYLRIGGEIGVKVFVAPELEGISSSAIRRLIKEGKIEEANAMLGRNFILDGIVEEGDRIGRKIGFPTANLHLFPPDHRLLPPFGVYASEVLLPEGRRLPGVTNIGMRPSVSDIADTPRPRIETHILGYSGESLYGKPLEVELLSFIRPEQKFPGIDALKAQLAKDISSRTYYHSD